MEAPQTVEQSRWQKAKRLSRIAGRFAVLSVALFAARRPMRIPREWYMPRDEIAPVGSTGENLAAQAQPLEIQPPREGEA